MDKRVIFAVAGSGKTTLLIRRLREDRRTLILTFTVNNEAHLRAQIIRRFGYIPYGIRVMTWFEFLHGFCFRPFLQEQLSSRGLSFNQPPSRIPRTNIRHYQDPAGRLYHRRLAHLLTARGLLPDIRTRLARYYDELFVDEVQDFAGHDFNFLITRYEARFRAAGIMVDCETLSRTWRCSATVCEFITGQLNIRISAHGTHTTQIEIVTDEARSAALHADNTMIKLFYREHHRYGCHSMNWGGSKGLDHFQDVCIVMGANHWMRLIQQKLAALPPSSRNRLYVACSRARGNIYFIPESHLRRFRN
ncbi:DNA helicase UvrD [Escherichia coli]|nr:DNA helicase UvrD [Escherichia coli]